MSIYVEGSYATVEDAIRAIDTLIMRGHDADSITLIHDQSHNEEQLEAMDITVKKLSELTSQENNRLGKHVEDLNDGRFVLQVTEKEGTEGELSADINPQTADRADSEGDSPLSSENESLTDDAELLEDVRNSNTDPSGPGSNDAVGYSSDLNTPDSTPLDNGPDPTL